MKKIGIIVNPVAGMGGRVGLKGSDGAEIQKKARELGAKAEAPERAIATLKELLPLHDSIQLFTAPFDMGEEPALASGFQPTVVGHIEKGATTAEDTIAIAKEMASLGVELLVFAGGDGTARNIYQAVGDSIPVLGIPAGVKIHSAVYAINPKGAGKAIACYLEDKAITMKEAEVMDIDENAFRQGNVQAKLYGYMKVPEVKAYMQSVKSGGYSEKNDLAGIAAEVIHRMQNDVYYIVGPGTTTRGIMEELGLPNTLLGMDVVCNKRLVASDVNELELYHLLQGKKACIIVTVIGGQGHVFGRGNQQLSPRVLRLVGKENMMIVATKSKLFSIFPSPLLADTGDLELDQSLSGWVKVITGWGDNMMFQLEA